MGTNEIIRRRALQSGGSAVDWETMLKGVVEGTLVDEFVFPSGTTSLRRHALEYTSFTKITIPDTVQATNNREYGALSYNKFLTEVNIGSGLNRIDESFLRGCTALESITIPSQVTSIGYMAMEGCKSLKEVILEPTTPPTLSSSVFSGTHADLVIYVPDASVSAYKSDNKWSSYASIIKGISERPAGGGS